MEEEMAGSIMGKIQKLSEEREEILAREGTHHAGAGDRARRERIDHDLRVLWDLRRRELAGETVSLQEDYYDRYSVDPGTDAPGRSGRRHAPGCNLRCRVGSVVSGAPRCGRVQRVWAAG